MRRIEYWFYDVFQNFHGRERIRNESNSFLENTARASNGPKSDRVFVTQEAAQATNNSFSEYAEGQTEAAGVQSLISSKKHSLQSKNTMLAKPP